MANFIARSARTCDPSGPGRLRIPLVKMDTPKPSALRGKVRDPNSRGDTPKKIDMGRLEFVARGAAGTALTIIGAVTIHVAGTVFDRTPGLLGWVIYGAGLLVGLYLIGLSIQYVNRARKIRVNTRLREQESGVPPDAGQAG